MFICFCLFVTSLASTEWSLVLLGSISKKNIHFTNFTKPENDYFTKFTNQFIIFTEPTFETPPNRRMRREGGRCLPPDVSVKPAAVVKRKRRKKLYLRSSTSGNLQFNNLFCGRKVGRSLSQKRSSLNGYGRGRGPFSVPKGFCSTSIFSFCAAFAMVCA